ncbi:MAG: hypothetical protein HQ477_13635 [Chloroflexi bacterium]|nr:hypothetical protein [Chloroflexota bacterium]
MSVIDAFIDGETDCGSIKCLSNYHEVDLLRDVRNVLIHAGGEIDACRYGDDHFKTVDAVEVEGTKTKPRKMIRPTASYVRGAIISMSNLMDDVAVVLGKRT